METAQIAVEAGKIRFLGFLVDQFPNNRNALQQILAVGCRVQYFSQVFSRLVKRLVASPHPEKALGNIIEFASVGDIGRPTFLAVEPRKLFPGKLFIFHFAVILRGLRKRGKGRPP